MLPTEGSMFIWMYATVACASLGGKARCNIAGGLDVCVCRNGIMIVLCG